MSEPLTEKRVCIALYWHLRSSSDVLIPRYTPRDWWECDMWRLTKAGFVDEYEVKLTVADFNADKDKTRRVYGGWDRPQPPEERKHDSLLSSDKGPNRFWFVTTAEIAERVTLPEYAGLILVAGHHAAHVKVGAPKLHGRKWDGNKAKLMAAFYHRYWTHEAGKQSEVEPMSEVELDATLCAK